MKPYYEADGITIFHGDCLENVEIGGGWRDADVLLTDPPYGIGWQSGHAGTLPRNIKGDTDTSERDRALELWYARDAVPHRPALVFGSWQSPRPERTKMVLIWDTKGALGMGDLSLPWKPAHQELYVLGRAFLGPRTSDVLCFAPVQSMAANGRTHPHEKPVDLLKALLRKCPPGVVADPFMGTGATLVAAKQLGRRAIGVEGEERYCEVAANRLSQGVMVFA